jgi:SAM-dependent methyltransferase
MLRRLLVRSPGVRAIAANGEALPFGPESFDLVTCSTAWHWLRAEPAVREVGRILRPGGHLVLVWANNEYGDGIDWEDAQSAVFESWGSLRGSVPPGHEGVGPRDAAADLRTRGIDVVVEQTLHWDRTVPREVHLQMLRTHSNNLILSDSDRDQLIGQIEAALAPWPVLTERLWGPLIIARF